MIEYLGVVSGEAVVGANDANDIAAGIRDVLWASVDSGELAEGTLPLNLSGTVVTTRER